MTTKEKIHAFLSGRKQATLEEIYSAVKVDKSAIRSVLNLSVKKKDGIFERIAEGTYKVGKAKLGERKKKAPSEKPKKTSPSPVKNPVSPKKKNSK